MTSYYCISHKLDTNYSYSKPIFVVTNFVWSLCSIYGLILSYVQEALKLSSIYPRSFSIFRQIAVVSLIMVVIMLCEAVKMLFTLGYRNNELDNLFMFEIFAPTILWTMSSINK